MRALGAALILGATFLGGVLVGQHDRPDTLRASLWADYCRWSARTEYLSGGGSYTALTAIVADWDETLDRWRSVSATNAKYAVDSIDCERDY